MRHGVHGNHGKQAEAMNNYRELMTGRDLDHDGDVGQMGHHNKHKKHESFREKMNNIMEAMTGRDLDHDGDVAQAGHRNRNHGFG
jgi:hypothetical protein